jgi:hypothetical protein
MRQRAIAAGDGSNAANAAASGNPSNSSSSSGGGDIAPAGCESNISGGGAEAMQPLWSVRNGFNM